MLVYVSGPLQGAAGLVAARSLYLAVAAALEASGHRAYVPHLHTDPEVAAGLEPGSVYDRDVAALFAAEAVVAHVGAPSTGVGAELAIAHNAGLRIVGLRRTGEPVSRFAQGLIERAGGVLVAFGGRLTVPAGASGRGRYVVVTGAIAAGASTLSQVLAHRLGWDTHLKATSSERASKLWLRGPDRALRAGPEPSPLAEDSRCSPGRGRAEATTELLAAAAAQLGECEVNGRAGLQDAQLADPVEALLPSGPARLERRPGRGGTHPPTGCS